MRSFSLQNFDTYKERESLCSRESVVTAEGTLVDYSDLELRRNPPNVEVDNKTHPSETIITIDSANKPGTLVEAIQVLKYAFEKLSGGAMFDRNKFDGQRGSNFIRWGMVCRW